MSSILRNSFRSLKEKMGNSTSSTPNSPNASNNESSKRHSRTGSSSSLTASNHTLDALREECIELGVEYSPDATKEELLELIAVTRNKKRPSIWKMASDSYDELVKAIIRPPRANYSIDALGRKHFHVDGASHERIDFELNNLRGLKIQCSWWRPRDPPAGNVTVAPCCVYLHGNSSCRAEALETLPAILGSRITLFAFDFTGSGQSDGEYVSLGYYEREDLETVIKYLRDSQRVSTIALWGRSMGAVTALMFADRDPSISCMIVDSPFSSLKTLAKELVESAQLNVPRFAVGLGLRMVRSSVKSRAGFDINAIEPIANVGKCFVPCLFGAGVGDKFIRPKHAEELHAAYAGDKRIDMFTGDHNSKRPEAFLDKAVNFMHMTMIHDGTLAVHASEHHVNNLNAGAYHMPAPLAHSPSSAMVNGAGGAFESTLHDQQYRALMMLDQEENAFNSVREPLPTSYLDEVDADDQLLAQVLELSLREAHEKGMQPAQ